MRLNNGNKVNHIKPRKQPNIEQLNHLTIQPLKLI